MALTSCPDCKKEISSGARECPNCGKRIRPRYILNIIIFLGSLIITMLLIK